LIKAFTVDVENMVDVSIYVSAITASGTLCLTSVVWYLKNSQAEKVARIKADTYRIASEERYKYNEKMLKLKKKYNYTSDEITEIEDGSPMDELEGDALNSLNSSVDQAMDEATSSIDVQSM
jgi:hypothetical protein